MQPHGNIKKANKEVPDVVKKTAAKSFFANRALLFEDDDSCSPPPPLSPQAPPRALHIGKEEIILTEDDDPPVSLPRSPRRQPQPPASRLLSSFSPSSSRPRVQEVVMCVDDDDEIQELETSVRVPPPPVVIVSDGSKKANNSRLEKLEQPSAAVGLPISRQPQVQQQNGGLSDISECEEEVPAESGRTTSPVRSKVSAVAKTTSPSRSPSIRSPERGRKAAVAAHDAKLNGVQPAGERSAIPEEAVALCTTASAVFGLQEDALNQQPPLKRRKRTKTNNKSSPSHQEEDEAHSDTDSAAVFGGENADSATKSPLDHLIPTDIRFDPKSLENKPKGLVDALSNFFTPGLKRTSRTAMNSLLKPEIRPSAAAEATPMTTSGGKNSSDAAATELTKKVRLSVDEKEVRESSGSAGSGDFMSGDAAERKRHASAGQQQVKSLYDGLSHLYSDCDSRLRSVPTTNYNERG